MLLARESRCTSAPPPAQHLRLPSPSPISILTIFSDSHPKGCWGDKRSWKIFRILHQRRAHTPRQIHMHLRVWPGNLFPRFQLIMPTLKTTGFFFFHVFNFISQLQFTFSIILYYFYVHRIVVRHAYKSRSVPTAAPSTQLAPCRVIAVPLTAFPGLHCVSPGLF